jgi:hypothetical protein
MGDSFVNVDTMPAGGYTHMGDTIPSVTATVQTQQQQQQQQQQRGPSLYETRENTPIRPPSSATANYGTHSNSNGGGGGWPGPSMSSGMQGWP